MEKESDQQEVALLISPPNIVAPLEKRIPTPLPPVEEDLKETPSIEDSIKAASLDSSKQTNRIINKKHIISKTERNQKNTKEVLGTLRKKESPKLASTEKPPKPMQNDAALSPHNADVTTAAHSIPPDAPKVEVKTIGVGDEKSQLFDGVDFGNLGLKDSLLL